MFDITNALDRNNHINHVIFILKYYLYKCRCVGDKPSINGDIKYLYHCIQTKKTPINVLSSKQKECTVKSRVWSLYFTIHTLLLSFQFVFRLCTSSYSEY